MTRARNGAAPVAPTRAELAQMYQDDREMGDGPEPGDQFGSSPLPLDEPIRRDRTQTAASRRKAGRVPLQVWITREQKRRLEWIRATDGHDFATIVGCAIDMEWDDRKGERG